MKFLLADGGRILIVRLYVIKLDFSIYTHATYIGNFDDENIIIILIHVMYILD